MNPPATTAPAITPEQMVELRRNFRTIENRVALQQEHLDQLQRSQAELVKDVEAFGKFLDLLL